MTARSCDECEVEDSVEALPGAVAGSGGPDELASLLLEMTALALKAAVLLAEADDEDWRFIAGRLGAFHSIVAQFPTGPRPRRRVGFQVAKKANKKGRKK